MYIPLTKPYWGKKEEQAVLGALRTSTGSGDGPGTQKLIARLTRLTKSPFVLPVTSCTHGLELAMAAYREIGVIGRGDEVIIPSFTMTSTANCVIQVGAVPVFADIEDKTFNIDPKDIERKITKKTKGIIVVHYAGMACAMDEIRRIARLNKLFVIEDAAHAIGASYKGKSLGTVGDVGVYSFHGTKNASCGEGGVVLTANTDLVDRMEIYRANGTNRKAFLEGKVDKYSWVSIGTSFFLSDILAYIAAVQIDQLATINKKRSHIATRYTQAFEQFTDMLKVPSVPVHTDPNWHIYPLLFSKYGQRRLFIQQMRKKGIEVSSHYVPLHTARMGQKFHNGKGGLPVTERVANHIVRLPIYPGLTEAEQHYIISSAQTILDSLGV